MRPRRRRLNLGGRLAVACGLGAVVLATAGPAWSASSPTSSGYDETGQFGLLGQADSASAAQAPAAAVGGVAPATPAATPGSGSGSGAGSGSGSAAGGGACAGTGFVLDESDDQAVRQGGSYVVVERLTRRLERDDIVMVRAGRPVVTEVQDAEELPVRDPAGSCSCPTASAGAIQVSDEFARQTPDTDAGEADQGDDPTAADSDYLADRCPPCGMVETEVDDVVVAGPAGRWRVIERSTHQVEADDYVAVANGRLVAREFADPEETTLVRGQALPATSTARDGACTAPVRPTAAASTGSSAAGAAGLGAAGSGGLGLLAELVLAAAAALVLLALAYRARLAHLARTRPVAPVSTAGS